jgi:hypothetical protein
MTRRIWSAILVIAAALATAVSGQEAPGGRAVEDSLLDSLVGHWNLSREIRGSGTPWMSSGFCSTASSSST